jgi:PAS domain S-box-containing protein
VSLVILGLYAWAYLAHVSEIGAGLLVSDTAALTAAIALVAGVVSYLWTPQKYTFWGAFGAYALLCATAAILILSTGGVNSPFIALWMVIGVFAGVFGFYGLVPLVLVSLAYLIWLYTGHILTRETVMTVILTGELPLAVSYLIWHNKGAAGEKSGGKDQTFHELASELSQVSGQSEVVINAIADGVIALSGQGIIQLINPAAQQITGWTKQDALKLDYKSILKLLDKTGRDVTPANDPISQALATNKEVHATDLTLVTNAGKKILVAVTVNPIGQPGQGVIIVFRDTTLERREERQQAEFVSTAAHEMRTPVASIEGYLGLALNPATAQIDEKARDFINKAHESAQHLGTLFQDLLDVSKAEDGRLTNNPKVVDVVAFTHDIVTGLRPKAEQKGLRMLFKPQPDDEDDKAGERRLNPVYYANVDNEHLREVISNLVDNAIKYTPQGDVVIDISGDTDHVQISIADSGIGIPKEDQAHLFQKFYRVDNSETREIGGTGLGLYLCRRLVEAMNGRIWADSEYKRGSTFYVEIPRIDHEEATRLIEAASIEKERELEAQQSGSPLGMTEPMPVLSPATPAPTSSPQSSAPVAAEPATTPTEPLSSDETVYTSMPAAAVAQQMQQAGAYQPNKQQPAAQVQYATAPQYQPPQAPVSGPMPPPAYGRPAPMRTNTPLTSIEQHPEQYLRPRDGSVSVPPRQQ